MDEPKIVQFGVVQPVEPSDDEPAPEVKPWPPRAPQGAAYATKVVVAQGAPKSGTGATTAAQGANDADSDEQQDDDDKPGEDDVPARA